MTASDKPSPEDLMKEMGAFAERSQRAVQSFWERQLEEQSEDGFSLVDQNAVSKAFFDFSAKLMADPAKLAEAQLAFWQRQADLWQRLMQRARGEPTEPLIQAGAGDRRFRDPAWDDQLLFDYIKQSYLLSADWMRGLVDRVDDQDEDTHERVAFYTRQFISAMSPTNFALTNPAVMEKAKATGGQNLIDGLKHLLADLERGKGRLKISMVDEKAFEVGKNVAVSDGQVIYQNDLMQLIQYTPTTEMVFKRPLLLVPPWINKFYVLDLQPKNSFIQHAVDQGHTVFVVSWANPSEEHGQKAFEDYLLEGPLAAMSAIEKATGEREINILGFCIGGILVSTLLGHLAARGEGGRIKSATFLTSLFDFEDVGEARVFIDDDQITQIERHTADKGYLESRHMADMFSMMRENDLIWSFVVNNYLMGPGAHGLRPSLLERRQHAHACGHADILLEEILSGKSPARARRADTRRHADRFDQRRDADLSHGRQRRPHSALEKLLPRDTALRRFKKVRARRIRPYRRRGQSARRGEIWPLDPFEAAEGSG